MKDKQTQEQTTKKKKSGSLIVFFIAFALFQGANAVISLLIGRQIVSSKSTSSAINVLKYSLMTQDEINKEILIIAAISFIIIFVISAIFSVLLTPKEK